MQRKGESMSDLTNHEETLNKATGVYLNRHDYTIEVRGKLADLSPHIRQSAGYMRDMCGYLIVED